MRIIKIVAYLSVCCLVAMNNLYAQSYSWKSVNLQGMGYVTGLIVHPTGGQLYARTDVYGIYKWDVISSSWQPLMDGKIASASVETFAIDPGNENILYAVCGNYEYGKLFKSENQGASWSELPNFKSKSFTTLGNGPWRGAGERLAVDPNNAGKVLLFGSRTKGLWKSIDNGVNWTQVSLSSVPAGTAGGVIFVVFDPSSGNATTNSQKIFVGVQGQGIYSTTDGGETWNLLAGGPATSVYPCRAAISNNGTLYTTYASADGGGATGYVYTYTGSGSLTNVTPANKAGQGFWGIAVDKSDANKVSTIQWNPSDGNKAIHFSDNGGATWKALTFERPTNRTEPLWYPTWAGWTWVSAMVMDPSDYKKVWLATGYGVYQTDNVSVPAPVWKAQMANFEELVVNVVKCPPLSGGADLITGFADQQGFRVANKDVVPLATFEPEKFGITTAIDYCETDPSCIVTVGGNQNNGADGESSEQKYRYSTDNGLTWTNFTRPTPTSVNGGIAISCTDKNRWVIAPKDRKSTYNDPHYTTDAGNTWTASTGTPVNTENGCTEQWSASEFLVADKVNGMTFYYYCDKITEGGLLSGFYRSTDGGASFVQMNTGLPSSYKSKIAAVPGKEGYVFYCRKDNNGSLLYLTKDGGASWSTISTVESCKSIGFGKAIAPSVEPAVYIFGSINGKLSVYRSDDFCVSWTDINNGTLPLNISGITGDMRNEGLVYLATGGRGVIYGTTSGSVGINTLSIPDVEISVFPNPASSYLNVKMVSLKDTKVTFSIANASGQQITAVTKQINKGENTCRIELQKSKFTNALYVLTAGNSDHYKQISFLIHR